VGADLAGQVLGVLGLGKIGSRVAAVGTAFGMKVIAWSENLTRDRAESADAELVSKEELFRRPDGAPDPEQPHKGAGGGV